MKLDHRGQRKYCCAVVVKKKPDTSHPAGLTRDPSFPSPHVTTLNAYILDNKNNKLPTCRKDEAPGREAEVPCPVHLTHAVHVSREGILSGALVRSWEAVDPLAALQVAKHVGPVVRHFIIDTYIHVMCYTGEELKAFARKEKGQKISFEPATTATAVAVPQNREGSEIRAAVEQ